MLPAVFLISLAACGGSSGGSAPAVLPTAAVQETEKPVEVPSLESVFEDTVEAEKEEFNGFVPEECVEITKGGFSFSLPGYYVFSEKNSEDKKMTYGIAENDKAAAMVVLSSADGLKWTVEDFEKSRDQIGAELAKGILETAEIRESRVLDLPDMAGGYAVCDTNSDQFSELRFAYVYDPEADSLAAIFLIQLSDAQFSYTSDFDKVVESISRYVPKEVSASGEHDPELVKFLESYEAFVDEYVEFMQAYMKNPTDLNLLMRYSSILAEYAKFTEAVDKYDTEDMSEADALYFAEVTLRCSQKLLKALR